MQAGRGVDLLLLSRCALRVWHHPDDDGRELRIRNWVFECPQLVFPSKAQ